MLGDLALLTCERWICVAYYIYNYVLIMCNLFYSGKAEKIEWKFTVRLANNKVDKNISLFKEIIMACFMSYKNCFSNSFSVLFYWYNILYKLSLLIIC